MARPLRCYAIDGSVINQPGISCSLGFDWGRLTKELTMTGVFFLIAGVIIIGLYFVVAPAVLSTYRRYRGRKTIICPETDQIVEMELKAGRAGVMAALGKQDLRVKWCSLWPRRKGCAEECVKDDWPAAHEQRDDERRHANGV